MKTPPKLLPTIKAILDEHVTLTVEYHGQGDRFIAR